MHRGAFTALACLAREMERATRHDEDDARERRGDGLEVCPARRPDRRICSQREVCGEQPTEEHELGREPYHGADAEE